VKLPGRADLPPMCALATGQASYIQRIMSLPVALNMTDRGSGGT
jgi:hypothetical protein